MKHDVRALRRRAHALGPRHRGARVPAALRAAIAAYARDERAGGASCGAMAERLRVSAESIRRRGRHAAGTRRPDRRAHAGAHRRRSGAPTHGLVTDRLPVEGLSVAETAELLRRLA